MLDCVRVVKKILSGATTDQEYCPNCLQEVNAAFVYPLLECSECGYPDILPCVICPLLEDNKCNFSRQGNTCTIKRLNEEFNKPKRLEGSNET